MATWYDTLSGGQYRLKFVVTQQSQNVAANTSTVAWSVTLEKLSGTGRFSDSDCTWSISVGGQTDSGVLTAYDFRNYSSLLLDSGTFVIAHNADGKKTISNGASFRDPSGNIGDADIISQSLTLTTIPRATTPTFAVTSVDAGDPITITTNRASPSFTHTVEYKFGAQTGTVATNVGTGVSWTPPLSLLTEIPSATFGTVTITVKTYDGATLIGTKTGTFTLTVPTEIIPDFTIATPTEAVAAVSALVGAFVQNRSKLNLALTGVTQAYGSPISTYSITVAGQTITAASGTTNTITQSGTVTITAEVTDARGRKRTRTLNITVLAYSPPAIDTALLFVRRAIIGGTPDDEGTYIRADVKATVSSLINGTQRNEITVKMFVRLRGTTTWILEQSVNPAGAISYNSFLLDAGPYLIDKAYEVRIQVVDEFGDTYGTSTIERTVATAAVLMHWAELGIGVGKYWEQGTIDAAGAIYQAGLQVIDTGDAATSTVKGIVELATTTEAAAGTDTTRVVTPAGLAAGLASNGGLRLVDTVEFTASGTFTKSAYPWLRAVRVRVQAAGGAGGGAVANPVNQHSSGGGGGGGGYAEALVPAASLAASTTVTIGAAGNAVTGGGGGNAAASSFGGHAAANGGSGGGIAATSTLMIGALGGLGGSGTAGDVLTTGGSGGMGSGNATLGHGGLGGSSVLGGGGRGAYTGAGGGNASGGPGGNYGGGGGGGSSNSSGAAIGGGDGAPGIIIIELYA